jgi:hypothetical protein
MINEDALRAYLGKRFRGVTRVDIRKLGSGVQGSGFLVELKTGRGTSSYVVKSLIPEGFGHDYPSDRAAVFLLDLDEFNSLPRHVKAIDVLAELENGSVKSIGGGKEYYLLMERGEGRDYFQDLNDFSGKDRLDDSDIRKIRALSSYLANIHSVKKDSRSLYLRKLRDTVGHGECLMGVLDMYPEGILADREMTDIIKKSVSLQYKLRPRYGRLSQIHGDFHPGNIWFASKDTGTSGNAESEGTAEVHHRPPVQPYSSAADFILLDRSRGPWGEPADDVTALTINYIFFSIKNHETVKGPYFEGLNLFYNDYVELSGDSEIYYVVQLFYAFRGVVVANPVFYPELTSGQRDRIFRFINNVLDSERFEPWKVNNYLG